MKRLTTRLPRILRLPVLAICGAAGAAAGADEFARFIRGEVAQNVKVVKAAGIKVD